MDKAMRSKVKFIYNNIHLADYNTKRSIIVTIINHNLRDQLKEDSNRTGTYIDLTLLPPLVIDIIHHLIEKRKESVNKYM